MNYDISFDSHGGIFECLDLSTQHYKNLAFIIEFKLRWLERHEILKAYQVLIKLVKNGIEYFNQQQEMASLQMNTRMKPFSKLPNFILFCLST